jgi:hypothetical protein
VNTAWAPGTRRNVLPDLLRRWFGPQAGKPGTDFRVRFRRSPEGWWIEPLGEVVALHTPRGELPAYPSLRAAAGAQGERRDHIDAESVRLPVDILPDRFAVRVSGDSMNGGVRPLRDGDWAVLEWARGRGIAGLEGRVALIARGDDAEGQSYHLKRVVKTPKGVQLRSDNPSAEDLPTHAATAVARLVAHVRPEDLGPTVGAELANIADAFSLSEAPTTPWSRVDGHLFVFTTALATPDHTKVPVSQRQPAETAFVLTPAGDGWRYAGVGRWDDGGWRFPPVDFATWKALGAGRSASRRLDPRHQDAARRFVVRAGATPGWVEARGKRCRLLGPSARAGLRIDGGTDGFKARTVSATDLAWVLAARERAAATGAPLDEALVNRLRYLDGTPKASTRWIDTGWALVLTEGSTVRSTDA